MPNLKLAWRGGRGLIWCNREKDYDASHGACQSDDCAVRWLPVGGRRSTICDGLAGAKFSEDSDSEGAPRDGHTTLRLSGVQTARISCKLR